MSKEDQLETEVAAEIGVNSAEINQTYNAASFASCEPVELGELMRASEVAKFLGTTSPKVTLLYRRGVIRKYNGKYWGGYLKSDVEKLKRGMLRLKGDKQKIRKFELDQARHNFTRSIANLSLGEFHKLYSEACGHPSSKVGKLFCKLPTAKGRPAKHDSLYQFLYLSDTDQLDLKMALLLRDATRKNNNQHVRFAANRVTLPPPSAWSDARHSNVVKLLVDAASELYGVDFDVMNQSDYNSIAMSEVSSTLMTYLSGKTITTRTHLAEVIDNALASGEHIPLVGRVDYWYRCLYSLSTSGRFSVSHGAYIERMVRTMLPPKQADNLRSQANMKEVMDKAVGCFWWELYDAKWPPAYVGELPYIEARHHKSAFELNPKDKQLHPDFDPSNAPQTVWLRSRDSMMQVGTDPDEVVIELQARLMAFHMKAAVLVEKSQKSNYGVAATIIKALTRSEVVPEDIYLYPFLHPAEMLKKMDAVEQSLVNASYSLGIPLEDNEVAEVEKLAEELSVDSHTYDSAISPDGEEVVTPSDRERSVRKYYHKTGKEIPDEMEDSSLVAALERNEVDELNRMVLADWGYEL